MVREDHVDPLGPADAQRLSLVQKSADGATATRASPLAWGENAFRELTNAKTPDQRVERPSAPPSRSRPAALMITLHVDARAWLNRSCLGLARLPRQCANHDAPRWSSSGNRRARHPPPLRLARDRPELSRNCRCRGPHLHAPARGSEF